MAGVAANLSELTAHVPSIQRNLAALRIPRMTAAEIRALVKNGEAVGGVAFEDEAVNAIIARSIGYPYLASMLCHRAALIALDHGRTAISVEDVIVATDEAADEFDGRASKRAQLQIDQRLRQGLGLRLGLLASAAQAAEGRFTVEDIEGAEVDPAEIAAARQLAVQLTEEGVVLIAEDDELGRAYSFVEDSVRAGLWLRYAQARASRN